MRPFRILARPLTAAPFIVTGLESLRDPGPRAEQVAPSVKPLVDRMSWLPTKDPVALVRAQGAISLGAGTMLLLGKLPRLSMLLLAAQMVPTALAEHPYWTEDDPDRRAEQRTALLKNAGLLGALLLAATEPRPHPRAAALRRQLHDAQVQARADARVLARQTATELKQGRKEAARQVRQARREARRTAGRAIGR